MPIVNDKKLRKNILLSIAFAVTISIVNAQWQQVTGSSQSITGLAVKGDTVLAGTTGGLYLCTYDGSNWVSSVAGNSGLENKAITTLTANGNNIFAGIIDMAMEQNAGMYMSSDNGDNWRAINNGMPVDSNGLYYRIMSLTTTNNNIVAGTQGDGVIMSPDNGNSWALANYGLHTVITSLAASSDSILAGTEFGGVYVSTDSGLIWIAMNAGLSNRINALAINGNNIYAGTAINGVYWYSNVGNNWVAENAGLTSSSITSIIASGNFVFAGTLGGVYLSSDNGMSWIAWNDSLTNTKISSLAFSGNYIFAGTAGGVYVHQLVPTGVINYLNKNNSITIYPNPATNNITIECPSQSIIEVANIQGKKINTFVTCSNKTKVDHIGWSSCTVDVSALQSGMYLVKVKTAEGVEVGKFVKE